MEIENQSLDKVATITLIAVHEPVFEIGYGSCQPVVELSPRSSCDFRILFTPNTNGAIEASVTVKYPPFERSFTVKGQGFGIPKPTVAPSPAETLAPHDKHPSPSPA
jgi:hypothetical protein